MYWHGDGCIEWLLKGGWSLQGREFDMRSYICWITCFKETQTKQVSLLSANVKLKPNWTHISFPACVKQMKHLLLQPSLWKMNTIFPSKDCHLFPHKPGIHPKLEELECESLIWVCFLILANMIRWTKSVKCKPEIQLPRTHECGRKEWIKIICNLECKLYGAIVQELRQHALYFNIQRSQSFTLLLFYYHFEW